MIWPDRTCTVAGTRHLHRFCPTACCAIVCYALASLFAYFSCLLFDSSALLKVGDIRWLKCAYRGLPA